jgi:hypothetical protein
MQVGQSAHVESQSLRWALGLTTVLVVLLIMILVDAPELISGRWIVGVMTVPAVGALLSLSDQSRWRVVAIIFLILLAAVLLAAAIVVIADSYVSMISGLLVGPYCSERFWRLVQRVCC